jgi:AcrR family transcriptional regulator
MKRKDQAQNTKKSIFETAVRLINEFGYQNISVSQICDKVGIAKGTFYVHYKSKEDIIRESYYLSMEDFILPKYEKFVQENPDSTIKQRMMCFLMLELEFTQYAGYELTCLAYITNMSECIPGPSRHFERRTFTKILKQLIDQGAAEQIFDPSLTDQEIFLYLESFIRGLMASWCFSNHNFDIAEKGCKFVEKFIGNIIRNTN